MINKKYQVFISSTYTDLIEERRKAIDAVLCAQCMPAGMEAFYATDENQFEVIKKVIDLCDFYVLIIGNRYGSIFPNQNISYTEMEYEYALSKDVPVLVFILDDECVSNSNEDKTSVAKLCLFKEKVKTNRLVSFWKTKDELFGQIIASLYNAISQFNRPGWVRGGNFDESKLLAENKQLSDENAKLKKQIHDKQLFGNEYENIKFPMHYTETIYVFSSGTRIGEKNISPTLGELFKHVSLSLTSECSYYDFKASVDSFVNGYHTDETTKQQLKAQFLIFNLIEETTKVVNKKNELYIKLSEYGRSEMVRLNRMN